MATRATPVVGNPMRPMQLIQAAAPAPFQGPPLFNQPPPPPQNNYTQEIIVAAAEDGTTPIQNAYVALALTTNTGSGDGGNFNAPPSDSPYAWPYGPVGIPWSGYTDADEGDIEFVSPTGPWIYDIAILAIGRIPLYVPVQRFFTQFNGTQSNKYLLFKAPLYNGTSTAMLQVNGWYFQYSGGFPAPPGYTSPFGAAMCWLTTDAGGTNVAAGPVPFVNNTALFNVNVNTTYYVWGLGPTGRGVSQGPITTAPAPTMNVYDYYPLIPYIGSTYSTGAQSITVTVENLNSDGGVGLLEFATVWLTTDPTGAGFVAYGTSGPDGIVTFSNLANGTYYVWCTDNPDFAPQLGQAVTVSGNNPAVTVVMAPFKSGELGGGGGPIIWGQYTNNVGSGLGVILARKAVSLPPPTIWGPLPTGPNGQYAYRKPTTSTRWNVVVAGTSLVLTVIDSGP